MLTITLSTPDSVLTTVHLDPNELDALRQVLLLGTDIASDAGIDTQGSRLIAQQFAMHC